MYFIMENYGNSFRDRLPLSSGGRGQNKAEQAREVQSKIVPKREEENVTVIQELERLPLQQSRFLISHDNTAYSILSYIPRR